jgi:hypothetical protein
MSRALKQKREAIRRRPVLAAAVLFAAIIAVIFVSGSGATSAGVLTCLTSGTLDASAAPVNGGVSNFEIDAAVVGGTAKKPVFTAGANLTKDGAGACIDWSTKAKGVGTGTTSDFLSGVAAKDDKPSGSGDDSFTGGTSEGDTTPTISSGSIPPNKSDLQKFGVYRESNPTGKFLNLFWSRINAPSGTTDMDFELNKLVCDGTAAKCSNNGSGQFILPLRSNGDRLITYDLANGGTNPTISIYTWSGNSTSGSWTNGTVISGGTSPEALGSINFDPIAQADSAGLGAKDPLTFGEVSVSYKALFGGSGTSGCGSFGSVFLKSRSSNTFTDELKDFVAPEAVQITNCTTLTTNASNQSTAQTLGGTISDTATLANAQSPTNGVVFKLYGPFDPTTAITSDACVDSGTGKNLLVTTSAIALTGPDAQGNYTASVPTSGSGSYAPLSAGRYEWVASYAADSSNGASNTNCGDSNEQSLVGPVTPTLVTSASNGTTGAALGGTISDTATLTGTALEPDGSTPAKGTITFKAYLNDNTCQASALAYTSDPVTVSGDRNATTTLKSYANSPAFTPKSAGTYYWVASYTGDSPNTNGASETCGGTNESSIVSPNSPTISTNATAGTTGVAVGTALDDTATLSGTAVEPDGSTPAKGTITFKLYGPSASVSCIDPPSSGANLVAVVTIGVNGDNNYKASNGSVQSGTLSPTSPGTYWWSASYDGDSPNTSGVTEACGGNNESSIVVKLNSTITTNQAWTPQDSATIDHSGGTVAFSLYKNDPTCSAAAKVYGPDTENVTGNGPFIASTNNTLYSISTVNSGDTYYWKAVYTSGDAQHKDVTENCTEMTAFNSLNNGLPTTSN